MECTNKAGAEPNEITITGVELSKCCCLPPCLDSVSLGMCICAMLQCTHDSPSFWSQDRSSCPAFSFTILRCVTAVLASCHGLATLATVQPWHRVWPAHNLAAGTKGSHVGDGFTFTAHDSASLAWHVDHGAND